MRAWHVVPVLAVVMAIGACESDDPSPAAPTAVRGISLTAELNAETGAVVLPADRFTETFAEMDTLSTGAAVAISRCAAAEGVTFVPPRLLTDPIYASEQYYGPWTRAQAERFGFVRPMSQADLVANGIVAGGESTDSGSHPNADLTDEDWTVIDACNEEPEATQLTAALRHVGPWYAELDAVSDAVFDDAEAKDAARDLDACFAEEGLGSAPDGSPGLPRGADASVIDEQQVQLALTTVDCKEQTNFTARVAAVEARLQAPIVVKYADELVRKRAEIDEALLAARAFVDRE